MTGRRRFYGRIGFSPRLPGLVDHQVESYRWLVSEGLSQAMSETVFSDGGERMEMRLLRPELSAPSLSVDRCVDLGFSYDAQLRCSMRVRNISTGEVVEREGIRVCILPLMTEDGCFVISGSRRVVVSQFVRAPGIYFSKTYDPGSGDELASSRFLPQRGTRIMMEMSGKRILTARLDNGRRFGAAA